MRFLFAAGGTAGHIYPAVAIANQLRTWLPDCEILFVGARGKMELELVPKEGYAIKEISISNFQRKLNPKGILHNIGSVKNLITSAAAVNKILDEFAPQVVIGTGGYVCYPVLKQAAKRNVPTVLHESNVVPGLTTKRLAHVVDKMLLGVKDAEKAYAKKENITFTGIPVRKEFLQADKQKAKEKLNIKTDKPLVLSFWGSLGALHMNNAMPAFFEQLSKEQGFYHIHATGGTKARRDAMLSELHKKGITNPLDAGIDIRTFISDMPSYMAAADLVICRAGASTLAELTAVGRASVLVPSPYVTANHQTENAKVFVQNGASDMLLEKECSAHLLYETVSGRMKQAEVLAKMEQAAKALSNPKATEEIAKIVLNLAKV